MYASNISHLICERAMLVLSRHPTSVMRSVRKASLSFRHTSSISKDDSEKLVHLMNKKYFL